MSSPLSETETGEKPTKEEAVVENTTPDYAAGLVSTQVSLEFLPHPFLSNTVFFGLKGALKILHALMLQ